ERRPYVQPPRTTQGRDTRLRLRRRRGGESDSDSHRTGSALHSLERSALSRPDGDTEEQSQSGGIPGGDYVLMVPQLLTVEEYQLTPDPPGGRYELHHGEAVFVPCPFTEHKSLRRKLRKLIRPWRSLSASWSIPTIRTVLCRKTKCGAPTSLACSRL